jgi:glycosyltransferase involved in cell wall biosynthesis
MRVGLHVGGQGARAGGGRAFVDEVLRLFCESTAACGHRFVLIDDRGDRPLAPAPNVEIVVAPRPVAERVLGELRTRLGTPARKRSSKWCDQIARRHRVEVMWYLDPLNCPSLEVPFVVPVWDLQHRLQPIFPEVSTEGQWEFRETHYETVLRRAAIVITATAAGKAEIERFYGIPPERIRVLPYFTPSYVCAPAPASSPTPGREFGLEPGYLFYPAQFWPHKNHVTLLLALRRLASEHGLRPQVVFVGQERGSLDHVRQRVAELGLTGQVRFLGFVSQQDLVTLYRHAGALVFPTFFGPGNLPPLEAFALGCPALLSDVVGAREQAGEAALYFDPRDDQGLAQRLHEVLPRADVRRDLIARGRARAARATGAEYWRGVLEILAELALTRRCWSSTVPYHQDRG